MSVQADAAVSGSGEQFGVVGLGQMGGNLALQALEKGYRVVGYDPGGASEALLDAGLANVNSLGELAGSLASPRTVLLYVPAGQAVDFVLDGLAEHLSTGDVIVDGGNSYWGDSAVRHAKLAQRSIGFVDAGTSGGFSGARQGACFLVGGDLAEVAQVEPLLRALAVPGGYAHAGGTGAGHFAKLVHNGVEFGMMQAIGEGLSLLENFPHDLSVSEVLQAWRHGSVVRSWLIDLLAQAYGQDGLASTPSYVEDTGEVNWLVEDAVNLEVPIPVISQSVNQLFASRDERKSWARAIAAMRNGFGGHPFGPSERVARARQFSRIGRSLFPRRSQKN